MRKNVLITGAVRGIGRQTAISMAWEGYNVLVNYHSRRDEAQALCDLIKAESGVEAWPVYADMGNVAEIRAMFEEIETLVPQLDVLVNNAGISSEVYFLDATEADFDRMTAIDWKGLYFCSRLAAKSMIAKGVRGVIINLASNQVEGCWPRATIYGPTKAAVAKFTRNAGMELVLHGVRMVAIAPGYTNVGWPEGDIRLEAAARLPLRRFASTEEIAQGIIYLASERADYMVGSMLTIDGGATLPVVAANDFVE